jgi:predicted naringenin-chalcone synthase
LDAALADLARQVDATPAAIAASIRDLLVVSCTGYHAPGLDILLARDRGMPRDVRRVVIGHMGCYGGLVGMRQALAALRAHPGGTVALVCVELCSLHFTPSLDSESLTGYALFGDAAASALLTNTDDARAGSAEASGAEIVDVYCATEFDSIEQMSWTVTDTGFVMGLSPRVPVTLRRAVRGAVERLLAPHGLRPVDVTHWMVHPGGPSILEVVQAKLELSDEQMAPSRRVLREHGNCSSPTILMILDDVIRSRTTRPGEWGVMMAFGPGLTLELCLVRF